MAQPLPAWNEKSPPGGKVCRGNEDRLAIRLCEGEMAPLMCVCDEMGLAGRVSAYNAAIPLLKKLEQGRGQSGRRRGVKEKMHKQRGDQWESEGGLFRESALSSERSDSHGVCFLCFVVRVCLCVCAWVCDGFETNAPCCTEKKRAVFSWRYGRWQGGGGEVEDEECRRVLTAAWAFVRPLVFLVRQPFPGPLLRTEAERSAADGTLWFWSARRAGFLC